MNEIGPTIVAVIPPKRVLKRSTIEALEVLYARLPQVRCEGRCGFACGPIVASGAEYERLRQAHPFKVRLRTVADNDCVYLKDGRCTVYRARPLICRIWGTFPSLLCPHGCKPDRWLEMHEFVDVLRAIDRIGGPIYRSFGGGVFPQDLSFLESVERDPRTLDWRELAFYKQQIEDAQRSADAFFGKGRILIAPEKKEP